MHVKPNGPSRIGLATLVLVLAGPGDASAEACFPRCDYTHYYGPLDFSYKQPDLFGYPQQCGPQGNCTPYLAYMTGVPNRRLPVLPAPHVMPVRPSQP